MADGSDGPAVGVDVGGTKMLVVARDPGGALIAEALVPTGPATTGAWLERRIREFGESLDGRVARVAIAVLLCVRRLAWRGPPGLKIALRSKHVLFPPRQLRPRRDLGRDLVP